MKKRVIITGATGLIGTHLIEQLKNRGDEIVIFSRSVDSAKVKIKGAAEYIEWNYNIEPGLEIMNAIASCDAVIHLAGENIMARRWNEAHKERVLQSRVKGTRHLVDAIKKSANRPQVFISASAVGYYGTSECDEFNEESGPGNDFLAHVTSLWENEVVELQKINVREVRIRTGIVLDKDQGALAKMITPFKLFIGGPLGSGKQFFPWIHINDLTGIFIHVLDNSALSGAYNAVAPQIINMQQFAKSLGKVMGKPALFDVPEFALKLILGEGAYAVTQGAKVLPERSLDSGYNFLFPDINAALENILKQ